MFKLEFFSCIYFMLNLFLDHKFLLLPFLLVYIFCCLLICSSSRKDHLNVAGGVCVRINLIINSVNPEAYLGGLLLSSAKRVFEAKG